MYGEGAGPLTGNADRTGGESRFSPTRRWRTVREGLLPSASATCGDITPTSVASPDSPLGGGSAIGDGGEGRFSEQLVAIKDKMRSLRSEMWETKGFNATLEYRLKNLSEAFEEHTSSSERRLQQMAEALGLGQVLVEVASGSGTPSGSPSRRGRRPNPLEVSEPESLRSLETSSVVSSSGGSVFDRIRKLEKALNGDQVMSSRGSIKEITLPNRLAYLERVLGDSMGKRAREEEAQSPNRLLAKAQPKVSANALPPAPMMERMQYVEGIVGDSMEKHAREIAQAHVKLDLFAVRVSGVESAKEKFDALRADHHQHAADIQTHHATMKQRLDYLEKLIGDSADKHAQELAKWRAERAERTRYHAEALSEVDKRMAHLERSHAEHVDSHGERLRSMEAAHSKMTDEMQKHADNHHTLRGRMENAGQAFDAHASTLGERVTGLERKVHDLENARGGGT